jgi:hypothetical protein
VYEHVFGYTQRPIGHSLCGSTLHPSCAVLLDQLLAYGDLIDEARRDELAQYLELSRVEMAWFNVMIMGNSLLLFLPEGPVVGGAWG